MLGTFADLQFAVRNLKKAPAFTAVAVLSIAFGISANSTVFTLVDQVVLRALPVSQPARLVQVDAQKTESYGGGMGDGTELSYPMYKDLHDRNEVFKGLFCRYSTTLHVGLRGHTERVLGELVSGTYFPTLGVTPAAGRLLNPDEDRKVGGHPVAVLSYEFWQSRFNGDSKAIGESINLNGHPFEIVGVVRDGFDGLDVGARPDVYVPITMEPQLAPEWLKLEGRRFRWVQVFARLRDGMSAAQAEAGLQGLYHSLLEREASESAFATASSETKRKFLEGRLHITPARTGHSALRESVSKALLILMAIAAGVLLIVCANVANLLVARSAARYRELALRVAIGATRWQTIRLLLVECGVLAVLGTTVGLLLARWGAEALLQFYSDPDTPMSISTAPDFRIVAFTAVVAIMTVLLAGCVPALRGTRVDLATALRNRAAPWSPKNRSCARLWWSFR